MNRKKILQILLAASTLAGGITMSHTIVNAAPIDKNDNNLIQGTLSRVNVIKAQVVNVSTNLRVRSSSSINSTVLGYLNNGTNIEVVGEEGDWYKIKFNGEIAYVSKEYVNIENGLSTASLSISGKGQVVNVSSELRIRQAASTSSAIIGTLKNGETFDIISKSGGWYNIKTGSIIGFVSGEYVKEIQSTSSSESSSGSTTNLNGTVVNVSSNLRVRAGASTSTSVLGYLLNGEKVNVIGEEGNWYKIKYNNTTGYVAKEYIQVSGGTSTTPSAPETPSTPSAPEATNKTGKVINISSNLNVRSGAGTNYSVIGYLYNGNTVTITGESGNWYAISYNGTTGYVAK
ncbi:MAG: SH3 domain-containing protein, partial [Clostridiales bacterium]|nr:SH3 domain-containing protein [Clostridiales bacterium]